MRLLFAFISGGLFGAGLYLSGMTDTKKVQGWLDIFGNWDPTLAFVMGGAILPMALAWRVTERRKTPLVGGAFPPPPPPLRFDPDLILGSVFFGFGWGLAGLCPGPSIASLSYGGVGVWIFVAAMLAGMALTPGLRLLLAKTLTTTQGKPMNIRTLTPRYSVTPQIHPSDLPDIAAAGFKAIICNRPDAENPPALRSEPLAQAAAAAGLAFHMLPLTHQSMTPDNIAKQRALIDGADGPVLAYCASGTRCSVIWALSQAPDMPAAEILAATARAGYSLDQLRPQLDMLAQQAKR